LGSVPDLLDVLHHILHTRLTPAVMKGPGLRPKAEDLRGTILLSQNAMRPLREIGTGHVR
jgi:hypothetical protein